MPVYVTEEREERALVDPEIIATLCDDLNGDHHAVNGFISTFVRMWPTRLARVSDALQRRDVAALLDAVLSIRSSCGMIGAVRLEHVARDLELKTRDRGFLAAHDVVQHLESVGAETLQRLVIVFRLDRERESAIYPAADAGVSR